MNVRAVLRECAVHLLGTEPSVTIEHVVHCAYQRHGEAFAEASEHLVYNAAVDIVRKLMRDLTEDDDQQTLPGIGLPSAIAVPVESGTYYVRADKATWKELLVGREVRWANVAAAQAKLDAYDEALETLRPHMENDPAVTVAEAVQLLGER